MRRIAGILVRLMMSQPGADWGEARAAENAAGIYLLGSKVAMAGYVLVTRRIDARRRAMLPPEAPLDRSG